MPLAPKTSIYRIAYHRYTGALGIPWDHALIVDHDDDRICILPRPIAERVVAEQSLACIALTGTIVARDTTADEKETDDDPVLRSLPGGGRSAHASRHAIDFKSDLSWLTAWHDPELEARVWDEQRMREQIDRFNSGEGGRGDRSSQSKFLRDLIEQGPWRGMGVADASVLQALQETCGGFNELFDLVDADACDKSSPPSRTARHVSRTDLSREGDASGIVVH